MLILIGAVTSCTQLPSNAQRTLTAEELVRAHQWHRMTLDAGHFLLRAYGPEPVAEASTLTVYLEGDGLAWVTRSRPSTDPTPVRPMALQLALADADPKVVYLARPCQYVTSSACGPEYWLEKRFSPEIIAATGAALDALKERYNAANLLLVGYSGGGAVATLLAAERDDVIGLVTVAGNLDHEFWTSFHEISPLSGSLNPTDRAMDLVNTPQWHFTGASDAIVPPEVANAYVRQLPDATLVNLITKPGYDHRCCWESSWPALISPIRKALGRP
ncbi:alpha/beta fold hydrolase [Marinobacter persicus]|uniref:Alpha/beta hydrolase family protein n=1 Tax=Marinobacter persicus TaxID=930118 RepID=A0A2S6G4G2_9GAMM|nr:alpha/beta hydrolase [Marinobacter persicus]PPK54006.1 hypothetical protein B0H24_102159 [Marinobacter persicus]